MSADWHCAFIPNGSEPLVVCEREQLTNRVSHLTELVEEAFIMLATEDSYDPTCWFDRASALLDNGSNEATP